MPNENIPDLAAQGTTNGNGKAPTTIGDLLKHPTTVERFKELVPQHLSSDRLLRCMAQAIYKTPNLADCNPTTLLGAMMACASFGLEPNTPMGHCYLIPFEKTKWNGATRKREVLATDVNLIIGYRGYIDLARRSGTLVSIHADVVYEGDEFSFEYGSNMHLRHVPVGDRDGREAKWTYAHVKLTDGEAFEVLPYEEVMRIRESSQAFQFALAAKTAADKDDKSAWRMKTYTETPWVKHEHEMAAKTMVRRVSKWIPMSIEFSNAVQIDGISESGRADFGKYGSLTKPEPFEASFVEIEEADESTESVATESEAETGGDEEQDTASTETSESKSSEPESSEKETPEADAKPAETTKTKTKPKGNGKAAKTPEADPTDAMFGD